MIMKGRAPLRLPLAGLLALVLTAALALPAFATDSSQQTPPPPPPPPAVKPTATQALPPPPPPPTPPPSAQKPQPTTRRVAVPPPSKYLLSELTRPDLPADGKQLVEAFEKDRQAIRDEAERKLDLRREELVKALRHDLVDNGVVQGRPQAAGQPLGASSGHPAAEPGQHPQ